MFSVEENVNQVIRDLLKDNLFINHRMKQLLIPKSDNCFLISGFSDLTVELVAEFSRRPVCREVENVDIFPSEPEFVPRVCKIILNFIKICFVKKYFMTGYIIYV